MPGTPGRLVVLLAAASLSQGFGEPGKALAAERDRYGGFPAVRGARTGFFHVERIDGRAWLVTPEGQGFLSRGVNHLSWLADNGMKTGRREYHERVKAVYGNQEAFARAAVGRLRGWGFNTLGAWCDAEAGRLGLLPYAPVLNLLASAAPDAWLHGSTPDVFSEEFRTAVSRKAEELVRPLASDPWLLGYFTDNEISFGPDWRKKTTLLERMLELPAGAPGRQAAEEALARQGGDRKAAVPGFAGAYARRYFQVCRDAVRAADPHHLILGCRFAGLPAEEVAGAAAGLVDVLSINTYAREPDLPPLEKAARAARAPVLIGEFAFRARDSGLPNSRGAGPIVDTQEERASAYRRFVERLLTSSEVVGYHWFEHQDEPAEGRFDGEDSNYGLVDILDRPYLPFVDGVGAVNSRAEELARASGRPAADGGAPGAAAGKEARP